MKNITKFAILVIFLISGKLSFAQTVVVPNTFENTTAAVSFLGPLNSGARSYQLLINQSELTDMVGQNLDGISFRSLASATAAWPVNDVIFTDFDIYISESVAPASKSLVFANNVVGTQTQVRSGELVIEAGSWPPGGVEGWGSVIAFDIPYLYTGEHLLVEFRHTGATGGSKSVEATASGATVGANWTGSYTPPVGNATNGNAAVTRFSYSSATPVVSVEVDTQGGVPAEITIDNGTLQLEATVNPSDAVQTVTWSVESGSDFASVDNDGLVTAIDNGTVVVRAASTENTTIFGEISITITNQTLPVVSVEVQTQGGVSAEITEDGGTLQLMAVVNPLNSEQTVTWSVESGSNFASVDNNGLVTAIDNETVIVRATSTENTTIFGEISITITNQVLPVVSVEVQTEGGVSAEISEDGGTLQLMAVVNPSNSEQTVTWSVESGSDFASVDNNGLVTAIDNGTVVVRATSSENMAIFGEITITITNQASEVETIVVTTLDDVESLITIIGETLQLVATVNPSDAVQTVIWSVETSTDVVSVDMDGLVTALENGQALVRASSTENDTVFGEILVTVDTTASIDNVLVSSVKIYPNPTSGIAYISTNQPINSIEIFNITGQRILTLTNTEQIDLTKLNTGTYIARIVTEKGAVIHKIMKQ